MFFGIVGTDKPGRGARRAKIRPAHIDYLKPFAGRMFAAGPLFDDSGNAIGSLLIIDFPDRATAEEFTANDPYAQAGLFESVVIRAWKKVLPEV
jgi:hypothetical protein